MEQTDNIVKMASRHSLAIIDELGRGTSSTDGIAIAFATLKFLLTKTKCRVLFATHYHVLVEYFRLYDEIKFGVMNSLVDEQTEMVIFLYKLVEGESLKSQGIKVAEMIGLPEAVIEVAHERAESFNSSTGIMKLIALNSIFNELVDVLSAEVLGAKELNVIVNF